MRRRRFLSTVAAAGAGIAAAQSADQTAEARPPRRLKHRALGNTGRSLSIIGLGGIVVSQISQSEANDMVSWSWDRGVNYFDVAPTYGNAQERLGPALKPYRDRAFLACKTAKRGAVEARQELDESLRLLQTDHIDLYQFHGITRPEEVRQIMGDRGAMDTFIRARDKGLIRYIGFSAHSVDAALMAMEEFDFDTVLFPLNVVCVQNGSFGPQVIERAKQSGTQCLALKAMAWTKVARGQQRKYPKCWYAPIDDPDLASLAVRYTLDLPVVAAVPPGDGRLFKMAVEAALRYKPLEDQEREALLQRVADVEPIFAHET